MGEQVLGMKTTPGKGYSDRAPSVSWERPQKNFSYIFAAPHAISVPFCGGGGGAALCSAGPFAPYRDSARFRPTAVFPRRFNTQGWAEVG